tara:strand:- start:102 stop:590 length:489 start_codon:yes stop_codon:yes gene_type:complete
MSKELVEGWRVCGGWFIEMDAYGTDLMESRYTVFKDGKSYRPDKFILSPICNDHSDGTYVSKKFWIALVSMFGVVTEEGGEVSYDPQSVQPEMVSKNIIEFRDSSEEAWNQIRNTMAYIAGYNNFTWPMTLEESCEEDGKTLFIDMSGINQDKDDQIGTDES